MSRFSSLRLKMNELIMEISEGLQRLNARRNRETDELYGSSCPASFSDADIRVPDEIADFIRGRREESERTKNLSFGAY